MKKILMLLLMVPLAFAAWQNIAALAIVVSVGLLASTYMVGIGFNINQLKMIAKEEFFQLIALGLMVVVLVGTDSILNSISASPAFTSGQASMQANALSIISQTRTDTGNIFSTLQSVDMNASKEASGSSQCNVLGMGYSVSGCGGFTMLATPISMAGGILGFALGELSAMERLIAISTEYALTFLLPLGILLRTFKITRGAGGLLIAIGVSLHIMLPAGLIFNEMLLATFTNPLDSDAVAASADYSGATSPVDLDCNPADTDEDNPGNAIGGYTALRNNIKKYLFTALIRATFGPAIAMLMMAGSIKALTSIAGAEVDISAISRFV